MNVGYFPFNFCLHEYPCTDQQKPINNLFAFQIGETLSTYIVCHFLFGFYSLFGANSKLHMSLWLCSLSKTNEIAYFSSCIQYIGENDLSFSLYINFISVEMLALCVCIVVDLSNQNGKPMKFLYKVNLCRSYYRYSVHRLKR